MVCKFSSTVVSQFGGFRSKCCAETGLLDKNMLRRALIFYTQVAEYLLCLMNEVGAGGVIPLKPLAGNTPPTFAALPEWYVEDIAEFLLFTLQ